jgi:hypothetical protein
MILGITLFVAITATITGPLTAGQSGEASVPDQIRQLEEFEAKSPIYWHECRCSGSADAQIHQCLFVWTMTGYRLRRRAPIEGRDR